MTTERIAMVGNERHFVSVYEVSKGVWIAIGKYKNESIRVQGQTEDAALERWRAAATLRGPAQ